MASKLPKASDTLAYFDKYDYPLTREELEFWGSGEVASLRAINGYYFLPGRSKLVSIRKRREKISQSKWSIARSAGEKLKKFPTIKSVFVTGSLAMNNAGVEDDIDLMLITSVNTLWITRLVINIFFWAQRRLPGQNLAPDKLCINLWLDESALHIEPHDLYRAHEVLQAKVLWERNNTHTKFLQANAWVKEFLPNAYPKTQSSRINVQENKIDYWLLIINYLFFAIQYLYMKPKMTSERVTLHSAFFHPKNN
jgi:hypothetical protein